MELTSSTVPYAIVLKTGELYICSYLLIDSISLNVPLENISIIWRLTVDIEGQLTIGICSAFTILNQEGIFIEPHLLVQGASIFAVPPKAPPNFVALSDKQLVIIKDQILTSFAQLKPLRIRLSCLSRITTLALCM